MNTDETSKRPIFTLTVRAQPGVDGIRALRAWLKIGLRTFGLRCVEITRRKQEKEMDARQYASKNIKPDDVRDAPIQARIVNVFEEDRYNRLCLELETGAEFPLNSGNTNVLIKAWGANTDDWISLEVECYLDTYKDWRADPPEEKETVRVRAVSPAKAAANGGAPTGKPALPPSRTAVSTAAGGRGDMDDDIPFAPEWR
jgi:hypothetical protein